MAWKPRESRQARARAHPETHQQSLPQPQIQSFTTVHSWNLQLHQALEPQVHPHTQPHDETVNVLGYFCQHTHGFVFRLPLKMTPIGCRLQTSKSSHSQSSKKVSPGCRATNIRHIYTHTHTHRAFHCRLKRTWLERQSCPRGWLGPGDSPGGARLCARRGAGPRCQQGRPSQRGQQRSNVHSRLRNSPHRCGRPGPAGSKTTVSDLHGQDSSGCIRVYKLVPHF